MDLIEIEKMIAEATVKLEAENARLREELAAAQKDAERYRWLRDGQYWPAAFYDHDEPEPLRGKELDEAIDSAMKGEQP